MSKVQFWAIMTALCGIALNTSKTEGLGAVWGVWMIVSALRLISLISMDEK